MTETTHITWPDLISTEPLDPALRWNDDGVVIFPGLIDDELIDAYCREWEEANGYRYQDDDGILHADNRGGYDEVGYMQHPVLRELCCDGRIAEVLQPLMHEPAGVHLNLSGWVSTERSWHQDFYLNEKCVGDHYAAVWIALEDIHPDSGPFQYIPGSHEWGVITKETMGEFVDLADPMWPKHSETLLEPIVQGMIAEGAKVVTYLPRKGDLLAWHPRLLHQGSRANIFGYQRRALIAHYSGIHHRTDMPAALEMLWGGWLFPLNPTGRMGMTL